MNKTLKAWLLVISLIALCSFGFGYWARRGVAQTPAAVSSPATVTGTPIVEDIPPPPTQHFTDRAGITTPAYAEKLNVRLGDFERKTTDQFIVVIFPKLETHSTLEDYCSRVMGAWGVGVKGVNNGVVLFMFVEDHKMRLQVGSGVLPLLTNASSKDIINQMSPYFRRKDFEGGLTVGTDAVMKALDKTP